MQGREGGGLQGCYRWLNAETRLELSVDECLGPKLNPDGPFSTMIIRTKV